MRLWFCLSTCSLIVFQCRSWGKFWQAPTFVDFGPAANSTYTVRTGFLIGTVTNGDGAEGLEIAYDSSDDFQPVSGFPTFKVQLPTGSSTWRLDSRHRIKLRLRYANNGYSHVAEFTVRKGNNRDINGDGYPDLVVGADQYNNNNTGRVYIFLSRGQTGIGTQNAAAANAIITGENTNQQFGISLGLDDVNGDGFADLVAGAHQYNTGQGRVYIFHSNGPSGIATQSAGSATAKIDGRLGVNCNMGFSIALGDINGDGFADVVAGAYTDDYVGLAANSGHTYVFQSAGTSGITITSATAATTDLTGENNGSKFGTSVALGDFNGDGFADLVVGAPVYSTNTGRVFIFEGAVTGIPTQSAPPSKSITGTPAAPISLGNSVATGDFNGDGYTDFSTGAHGTPSTNTGAAFLFLSKPNFTTGSGVTTATSASFAIAGQASNDAFGFSVAFGDMNGDGKQDWFVHAQHVSLLSKAHVFHSVNGAPSSLSSASPNTLITSEGNSQYLGAFSGAYDINADGFDDLILGAFNYSTNTGRVYIYLSPGVNGIASGSATNAPTIITGESTNTSFGHSMPY